MSNGFVFKLYEIVDNIDTNQIITWNDDGSNFLILNRNALCIEVLPRHFSSDSFSSFNRQLNIYGFRRVPNHKNAFHHEFFQRGKPDLLRRIRRSYPIRTPLAPPLLSSPTYPPAHRDSHSSVMEAERGGAPPQAKLRKREWRNTTTSQNFINHNVLEDSNSREENVEFHENDDEFEYENTYEEQETLFPLSMSDNHSEIAAKPIHHHHRSHRNLHCHRQQKHHHQQHDNNTPANHCTIAHAHTHTHTHCSSACARVCQPAGCFRNATSSSPSKVSLLSVNDLRRVLREERFLNTHITKQQPQQETTANQNSVTKKRTKSSMEGDLAAKIAQLETRLERVDERSRTETSAVAQLERENTELRGSLVALQSKFAVQEKLVHTIVSLMKASAEMAAAAATQRGGSGVSGAASLRLLVTRHLRAAAAASSSASSSISNIAVAPPSASDSDSDCGGVGNYLAIECGQADDAPPPPAHPAPPLSNAAATTAAPNAAADDVILSGNANANQSSANLHSHHGQSSPLATHTYEMGAHDANPPSIYDLLHMPNSCFLNYPITVSLNGNGHTNTAAASPPSSSPSSCSSLNGEGVGAPGLITPLLQMPSPLSIFDPNLEPFVPSTSASASQPDCAISSHVEFPPAN